MNGDNLQLPKKNMPLMNLFPLKRSRDSVVLRPESSREFAEKIQETKR